MALISLRQLLDHAAENGYGMPAFNVNNMESAFYPVWFQFCDDGRFIDGGHENPFKL